MFRILSFRLWTGFGSHRFRSHTGFGYSHRLRFPTGFGSGGSFGPSGARSGCNVAHPSHDETGSLVLALQSRPGFRVSGLTISELAFVVKAGRASKVWEKLVCSETSNVQCIYDGKVV